MKIGLISDLHVDVNGFDQTVQALHQCAVDKELDLLLIAGDISNHYQISICFVETLLAFHSYKVIFVPGNHDYWQQGEEQIDFDTLHKLYGRYDFILQGSIILNKNWVLIGDIGWYDYSFGASKFNVNQLSKKKFLRRVWKDSQYIPKKIDDITLHEQQIVFLKDQINSHQNLNQIMMTHMISHPSFKVHRDLKMWDYFNAFLGSESLYHLTLNKRIKHVICGHVHYRRALYEKGKVYHCACLGTVDEFMYYGENELAWNINNALQIIEIGESDD